MKYCIVSTTCGTRVNAEQITDELFKLELIASVHMLESNSSYIWKNKRENTIEYVLNFRTKQKHYKTIQAVINKLHTYNTAEIILIKINKADERFKKWINDICK